MAETWSSGRSAEFDDRRMWRLLLARLHPDAGGDGELFAFACAVRRDVRGGRYPSREPAHEDKVEEREPVASFLQSWQHTMDHWATSNHDALKKF